jgi:hypothetical protein
MLRRDPREARRQVLIVAAVFAGVIVVWGLSMWAISASFRRAAYYMALERAQRQTLAPFVRQARDLGLGCEEAFKDPKVRLKPVLWEVEEAGAGGHCRGRPGLRFVWTNPKDAERRVDRPVRSRFTAVGMILEGAKAGRPMRLQYLGAWDPDPAAAR